MKITDFDSYLNKWKQKATQSEISDYGDPVCVRKANRASDQWRKTAKEIGTLFPDRVDDFAVLLNDENEYLRVVAAVSLVEYLPHRRDQLARAKEVVMAYMSREDQSSIGWEWWLRQPWADESACID